MNSGKTVKILGWGGTIDQANATSQNMSCDLLEASMQVNMQIVLHIGWPRWTTCTTAAVRRCQKRSCVSTVKNNRQHKTASVTVEALL